MSFVYQRYSLNNYAGLRLARQLGVPLVLEYNGSEIWMSRHWGRPLKYEQLSSKIELLNVNGADLVVVVSRAMRDELVGRAGRLRSDPGQSRMAWIPIGTPRRSTAPPYAASYGLDGKVVIGFISTFQPWHGADVLAHAFVTPDAAIAPRLVTRCGLLMIGSGPGLAASTRIISDAGLDAHAHFTGLVAQEDGARYLAACDILASPHVPNPDGSPFFGSPTKLFEYMAMGKAIVASNLDQIGEVLRHGETAWMVPPGDADALSRRSGASRRRSGRCGCRLARRRARDVLAHHTWRAHVQEDPRRPRGQAAR